MRPYKDTMELANAKETLTISLWKKAMQRDFQTLMSNKTWTLVPYQDQQNIVGSKWFFKIKYKSNGSIERRKARLVAKRFQKNCHWLWRNSHLCSQSHHNHDRHFQLQWISIGKSWKYTSTMHFWMDTLKKLCSCQAKSHMQTI